MNNKYNYLPALALLFAFNAEHTIAEGFSGTVQTFYAKKNYRTEDRDALNIAGVYGYLGYGKHAVEAEFDKNFTQHEDVQQDIILAYNNYQIPQLQLHVGYHQTSYSQINSTYHTPMLGAYYTFLNEYGYAQHKLGIDTYFASNDTIEALNFSQFSPFYGYYYAVGSKGHYLYSQLTTDIQAFEQDTFGNSKYLSGALQIDYVANALTLSLQARVGESVNQYKAGGFIFNNDDLIYLEGIGGSAQYYFNANVHAKMLGKYQRYENLLAETHDMFVLGALLGVSF